MQQAMKHKYDMVVQQGRECAGLVPYEFVLRMTACCMRCAQTLQIYPGLLAAS